MNITRLKKQNKIKNKDYQKKKYKKKKIKLQT